MRTFLVLFLLAGSAALAQTTTSAPMSSSSTTHASSINESENARKARALLQQMIQKLGGEAYLGVRDVTQEGRTYAYYQGRPNSLGTLFWRFWMFPDKERTEFTKDRDVAFIHVGDNGYEVTFKGTAAEEPEALKEYIRRRDHSLEHVLRVWFPDPKTALFWDGPAVAEQKPCDSITLLNAKNESVTLYVDSHTHLPVKKVFQWRDPSDRLKNEESDIYDNFRNVQGVLTPHTLLRTKNGEIVNQRFLTSVQYNTGLPESLFQAVVTYDPKKRSAPVK